MDEITTKICTSCGEDKPLEDYHKAAKGKYGRAAKCRKCINTYYLANKEKAKKRTKKYREANKEKIAKYQKEYRKANKEKLAKQRKEYYEANKEEHAKRNKEYYENNKEKAAKYHKEYRKANKEKLAKQRKEYYENNKEKAAKYREANRERIAASRKAWREANPEKDKEWKKANRDKVNEQWARRYALKKACTVEKVCYETIRERDDTCYLCFVPFTNEERYSSSLTHIDHKIPLARGGEHSYENCALTHVQCNLSKNDKTPEEYWEWIGATSQE